ncbi:MAG: lipoprotein insertase outer membrane protein LolB [Motiliproteus sp.]|nr:lipoprotein insertase outer membrane protein LolB [Motiliproteus sp.]MCW9051215.1 lipoprotein insertase outer membrane protein LolB [Motiliproteus sp.]
MQPRAFALVLLLSLAGCSSLSPQQQSTPNEADWSQRQQWLSQQQQWSIKGKIGIRQDQEITSATMNWRQQQDSYHIFMAGPMGQGAVDIQGNRGRVIMQVSGEGRYVAASPEQLLKQRLGWALPISNLFYWVRGMPAPEGEHQKSFDPLNRLTTLEQDDWKIQYKGYQSVDGGELPSKVILRQGNHLKVTLVIKEWLLADSKD